MMFRGPFASVKAASLAACLAAVLSCTAAAQTFLLENIPEEEPSFGMTWQRPDFDHDTDLTILSGVYDFRANMPVTGELSVDLSLPRVRIAGDEESENFAGNIYAGLKHLRRTGGRSHVVSVGGYFPTAEEDFGLMLFGTLANGEDRFKYMPNTMTITGNYAFFHSDEGGTRLGLEIGPDILVPTGDNEGDTELIVHYGLTAGYRGGDLLAAFELIGLMQASSEFDDFSDRFMHSVLFGASYLGGQVRPGAFYKLYLKDTWNELVDGVLGVKVELVL